jgi:glycosyltransferase involved in cell wall biosynthesis
MVADGVNGYRVEVGDIDAMADAMLKALELKDVRLVYKPSDDKDIIAVFNN